MSSLFELPPVTPTMIEDHLNKVVVYPVNGIEWWATFMDRESFQEWYANTCGVPPDEVDVNMPLTDDQLYTYRLVEHEFSNQPITYREALAFMFDSGIDFSTPELLATTEY